MVCGESKRQNEMEQDPTFLVRPAEAGREWLGESGRPGASVGTLSGSPAAAAQPGQPGPGRPPPGPGPAAVALGAGAERHSVAVRVSRWVQRYLFSCRCLHVDTLQVAPLLPGL